MEDTTKSIVVPYDFTDVAGYALDHAVKFAKHLNKDVALLHIVKKSKEIEESTSKLQEIAEKATNEHGVQVKAFVREGTIFETINQVSEEVDSALAIMGTHGMKGMQKITGSWALKVIVGSKVPFLVVQQPPVTDKLEKIVFPIEFKHEDKEKLRWANYLNKFYKVKILIVTHEVSDLSLKRRTDANIAFAKKYLENKKIDYNIDILPPKEFSKAVINYAKEQEAQLVLIMTTPNPSITDYAFGAIEQKLIANEAKVTIMCVNPRQDLTKYGGFSTGGG
jgi:nucleotide-binding universal stress UspA family protein